MVPGLLSVVQMTALPGLVLLAVVGFRGRLTSIVTAAFGLSFALNYGLVTLCVACGIYTRPVVTAIIVTEAVALLFLRRRIRLEDARDEKKRLSALVVVSLVAALISIAWALALWVRALGSPFVTWDAIHSWNRWATVFAGGSFPADIQYYPQLIPANWSISYLLLKTTSIEAFAKAPMGLFFVLTLVAIAAVGTELRSPGLLLAVPLTALLERKCLGEFLTDGYVDVPVAFFATASIALLMTRRRVDTRTLWVSCALAAAAALTKQAGVYIFLAWPLLAWPERSESPRSVLATWGTLAIAPFAFYATEYAAIARGANYSNIAYVTHDIFRGATVPQRVTAAFHSLGIYAVVFAFALAVLPLLPRFVRRLDLFVALPFTMIWACWFSYDRRNVALALPIIAIAAAAGGVAVIEWVARRVQRST